MLIFILFEFLLYNSQKLTDVLLRRSQTWGAATRDGGTGGRGMAKCQAPKKIKEIFGSVQNYLHLLKAQTER